jgi:hypothetical protein
VAVLEESTESQAWSTWSLQPSQANIDDIQDAVSIGIELKFVELTS